jgi:hypothetical protein
MCAFFAPATCYPLIRVERQIANSARPGTRGALAFVAGPMSEVILYFPQAQATFIEEHDGQ